MQEYEQQHLQALRGMLADCAVLLKTNGAFPLEAPGPIAAYGPGVRYTVRGGTGSGEVNARRTVTVEQGLAEAGFTVTTRAWLDGYDAVRADARKKFAGEVRARARAHHTLALIESMGAVMNEPDYALPLDGAGDTAVYVLARNSGEGADRQPIAGDILLTPSEIRDINALQAQYARFMLVLNVGGPVDLGPVAGVENILLLSQLGSQTGTALADLLLGRTFPSGKLATTWADWSEYPRIGEFGDLNDTRYKEGVYVGYRWFDSTGRRARFPFGFGLGYTSFAMARPAVTLDGETVTVRTQVTNTGSRPGKEVVQVYVSVPAGRLDQPYQTLAAFGKTGTLAPGGAEVVETAFRLSELAGYDAGRSCWVLEPGEYLVRVGSSSVDTAVAAVLTLDAEAVTLRTRPCGGSPDFADWKPDAPRPAGPVPADAPRLAVCAGAIPCGQVDYDSPGPGCPVSSALSSEQLALLNVGGFDSTLGTLSVIGTASRSVAGAAGETTAALKAQSIPTLVMADGPAGLRLTPQFYRDEKGVHGVGAGGVPASMADFIPAPVRLLMRLTGGGGAAPKGKALEEQYATALPIGTALAQSFDTALAERCGRLVGSEMERFGVHLWLAPALNIHRDIRCGRNFEYFSEDPLVSGRLAAALTRGVQSCAGRGVTIKHFAANNQETNRMNSNSQISQRALREIYLRGFGICVREAAPHAVMTAYNLINGVHVSERRDIIEDILRREFGFTGIVMTDWLVRFNMSSPQSLHRKADVARIAAAGGDLIMPGSSSDVKDLLAGLKSGVLTRSQLEQNAQRVIRKAWELNAPRR